MFVPTTTLENTTEADRDLVIDMFDLLIAAYDYMAAIKKENPKYNFTFSCHSICRALYMFYGNEIVSLHDGTYRGMIEEEVDGEVTHRWCGSVHSWLKTTTGSIVDPYPVGILNPYPILYVSGGQDFEVHTSHYLDEAITPYDVFDPKNVFKTSYFLLRSIVASSGIQAVHNEWNVTAPA